MSAQSLGLIHIWHGVLGVEAEQIHKESWTVTRRDFALSAGREGLPLRGRIDFSSIIIFINVKGVVSPVYIESWQARHGRAR